MDGLPRLTSPAELIREALGDMRQTELARRCGFTPKHVCEVLAEKAPVRWPFALAMEPVLGLCARELIEAQLQIDLQQARNMLSVRSAFHGKNTM